MVQDNPRPNTYSDGPVTHSASKRVEEAIEQDRAARTQQETATRKLEKAQQEFNQETDRHLRQHDRDIRWLKLKKDVDDMQETADQHGHIKELGLAIRFLKHAVEFAFHEGIVPEKLKKYFTGFKRATYSLVAASLISVGAIGYVTYKNYGLMKLETTVTENSGRLTKVEGSLETLREDEKTARLDITRTFSEKLTETRQELKDYSIGLVSQATSNQAELAKRTKQEYDSQIKGLVGTINTNNQEYLRRLSEAESSLTSISETGTVTRTLAQVLEDVKELKTSKARTEEQLTSLNNQGYALRITDLETKSKGYEKTLEAQDYNALKEKIRILETKELGYDKILERIQERIERAEQENSKLRIENKVLRNSQIQTNSPANH